jgi:dTDP-4-dehydrorhamnose reductase
VPAERVQVLPTTALSLKAARPRRAILDNRMLRARGLDTMPAWQDGVREYLASEPG